MGKIEENKQLKKQKLMDTAFALFTSKGIVRTSVADIVESSGLAKGTFYLYFRDKYDLQEKLIIRESEKLFRHALKNSDYRQCEAAEDKVLAITGDILDQMEKDRRLLGFINKNLSWGIFRTALSRADSEILAFFEEILHISDAQQLEILVYTIVELVSATCYSVILDSDPVDLQHYKPVLFRIIRGILRDFREDSGNGATSC